ncbi:hypothetical protein, partial [Vineibacter terrae]|uniref:hypothetical protein n=1 Tax=Vineibacter terrae TaxID=2586908 RepID=UPI002E331828
MKCVMSLDRSLFEAISASPITSYEPLIFPRTALRKRGTVVKNPYANALLRSGADSVALRPALTAPPLSSRCARDDGGGPLS